MGGKMGNHDFLERAFALADGGMVRTIDDIRGALLREGYTYKEVAQLSGSVLRRQLRARIRIAARNAAIDLTGKLKD
jgi:hypothetical protein